MSSNDQKINEKIDGNIDEAIDYLATIIKAHKGLALITLAVAGWIGYRRCKGKSSIPNWAK